MIKLFDLYKRVDIFNEKLEQLKTSFGYNECPEKIKYDINWLFKEFHHTDRPHSVMK